MNPTEKKLMFRQEVSEKDRKRWMGEILLVQSIPFSFSAGFSVLVALTISLALYFVEYTRKERVTGQVTLDKGSVKVFPQVAGVVLKRHFTDGDNVVEGQILFTINIEKTSSKIGDTQDEISRQLTARKAALQLERGKQSRIAIEEVAALILRDKDVNLELAKISSEVSVQQRRVQLARQAVNRATELYLQHFVSGADVDLKEQDFLEQQSRLQTLERTGLGLQRDLNGLISEIQNSPLRAENKLSEFDRQVAILNQDLAENESRRHLVVRAPQTGKATTVLVESGQIVTPDIPLVSILPIASILEVTLFVPTKAAGFIVPGHKVQMRYQAYPFQKFGQHEGTVRDVGRTALRPEELKLPVNQHKDKLYRVLVNLSSQTVMAYGKAVELQEGMQLEADILIDSRKLYEWILEPIYTLTGKI